MNSSSSTPQLHSGVASSEGNALEARLVWAASTIWWLPTSAVYAFTTEACRPARRALRESRWCAHPDLNTKDVRPRHVAHGCAKLYLASYGIVSSLRTIPRTLEGRGAPAAGTLSVFKRRRDVGACQCVGVVPPATRVLISTPGADKLKREKEAAQQNLLDLKEKQAVSLNCLLNSLM
eukprot:6086945-Amphidinium_carterae.1